MKKKTIKGNKNIQPKNPQRDSTKQEKQQEPIQRVFEVLTKQSKMINQLSDLINVTIEEVEVKGGQQMAGFIKSVREKFNEVKNEIYNIKGTIEINQYNIKDANN